MHMKSNVFTFDRSWCVAVGAVLAWLCFPRESSAVTLPAIFSDHMVLQQGKAVPVWGEGEPGEEVRVAIAGQTHTALVGADGRWILKLSPMSRGGPYQLQVKGKATVVVEDVLVGEVWLGSGQSNMAHPAAESRGFEETKAGANLPQVRMFRVESGSSTNAQPNCQGSWKVCSADTVGRFSAVLYFFGRELHTQLGGPVGLINSSLGATAIEAWTSPRAQSNVPGVGGLFNGKIAPLVPYTLGGVIWYQGEANAHGVEQGQRYGSQLMNLVKDWRGHWGYDLPFAWVQLPNFTGRGEAWCLVREGQLKALQLPQTGMAIAVDIGESGNIHPKNKQEVGRRLALWALGTVYGKKVPSISGPLPEVPEFRTKDVVLRFTHTEGGLTAKNGALKGFVIAGTDREWLPGQARIEGEAVIVSNPAITKPVAIRYAWKDNPDCNLYNGAGLPASPFRTDDW